MALNPPDRESLLASQPVRSPAGLVRWADMLGNVAQRRRSVCTIRFSCCQRSGVARWRRARRSEAAFPTDRDAPGVAGRARDGATGGLLIFHLFNGRRAARFDRSARYCSDRLVSALIGAIFATGWRNI